MTPYHRKICSREELNCTQQYLSSGESNKNYNNDKYNCSLPALVGDWRAKWRASSDPAFPFGLIQLGTDVDNGGVTIRLDLGLDLE